MSSPVDLQPTRTYLGVRGTRCGLDTDHRRIRVRSLTDELYSTCDVVIPIEGGAIHPHLERILGTVKIVYNLIMA
jgi:hypothetical protein